MNSATVVKRVVMVCTATFLALGVDSLPAQQRLESAVKQADIVFSGKVTRTGATSMRGVPKSDLLVEMVVDEVLEKPAPVSLAAGDTVTVLAKEVSTLSEGAHATVYAQGWILGDRLAVREVAHVIRDDADLTLEAHEDTSALEQIRAELAERELLLRAEAADLIVVGRVVSVETGTLEASPTAIRITEHDPEWTEATIEIESSIKGTAEGERVVVRFPASKDVAWYKSPKFSAGQHGTFLLTYGKIAGDSNLVLERGTTGAFTALETGDVLPKEDAAKIRRLLQR